MTDAAVIGFVPVDELPARLRIAALLDRALFGSLVLLVCLATIPYGTSHPWWKALFVCYVLAATIVAVVETALSRTTKLEGARVVLPVFVLAGFAFLQTVSLPNAAAVSGLSVPVWNAISADPYQTRFVALQLIALALVMLLLYRYASTRRRMFVLLHVIIGVAVLSAIYGILRQTVQRETGFLLPLLKPNTGYGQFINKNHFAFLMEMAFGVAVGLLAGGDVKRQHSMLYVGALLPIWTALVLSNSRGGILATTGQAVIAALLIGYLTRNDGRNDWWLFNVTRSRIARATLVLALAVGLIVGAIWVGGDRLVSNFEAVSGEFSRDDPSPEGVTRNDIWRATVRAFAAHPFLGVGLGGYWVAITAHHDASGTMTPREAHNDYLELLASGGIVGFAIGVWFVAVVFGRARENLRRTSEAQRGMCVGAILGISGVAVHSLFDFGLHMLGNALVFAVLITVATARVHASVLRETN